MAWETPLETQTSREVTNCL